MMLASARASELKWPRKILLVIKLSCGTRIANPMGNAIFRIWRLLTSSCNDPLCWSAVSNLCYLWRNYFIIAQFRNVMLQSSIHISDEQGISVNTSGSTLVLLLGNGYLSYSINDDIAKKVHTWNVYNYSGNAIDAIYALLQKHPELKNEFRNRYFITDTASCVLIPGSIADDVLSHQVLQHSIGDLLNATVLKQELPSRGAVCCFALPKVLEEYLRSNFPGVFCISRCMYAYKKKGSFCLCSNTHLKHRMMRSMLF